MLATWITRQLVFDGVITGLLYALLAMGIVLIYRATRVINFAVGAMGLVGGALFALLVVEWNVPFWIGAIVALCRRHSVRGDPRIAHHSQAVRRTARHRARRDRRNRPALTADRAGLPGVQSIRRTVPAPDRDHV